FVASRRAASCSILTSFADPRYIHSFPTRRSSDLDKDVIDSGSYYIDATSQDVLEINTGRLIPCIKTGSKDQFFEYHNKFDYRFRSEEHTSELQSRFDLVCRLLLEKKKRHTKTTEL